MKAFIHNAKDNDNYEFLVTFNSQVFAEFSISSDSVVVFKQVITEPLFCTDPQWAIDASDTIFVLFLFLPLVYVA